MRKTNHSSYKSDPQHTLTAMVGQFPTMDHHWLYYTYFNDPNLSDLTLKLSHGTVVHAHRMVLCRQFKYFSKLIIAGSNVRN